MSRGGTARVPPLISVRRKVEINQNESFSFFTRGSQSGLAMTNGAIYLFEMLDAVERGVRSPICIRRVLMQINDLFWDSDNCLMLQSIIISCVTYLGAEFSLLVANEVNRRAKSRFMDSGAARRGMYLLVVEYTGSSVPPPSREILFYVLEMHANKISYT